MEDDRAERVPIATRILFEDERVRIWELVLEPGEMWGPHEHEHEYIVVLVDGDRIALDEVRTASGAAPGYREAEVRPGTTLALPAGGIETTVNVGRRRYRDIEIELL